MVKIIETNLSVDGENNIKDHQARWVLIDDWRDYCKNIKIIVDVVFIMVLRVVCLEQIFQQMQK